MRQLAATTAALIGPKRYGAAALAGLLAAGALPPLGLWPVLFVSFPVLVWLLDGIVGNGASRGSIAWRAFAAGWLFGFGYFAASLYWIGAAFLVEAETFAWLMPLATLGLPAYLALYWGAAAAAAILLWQPGAMRLLVLAAAVAAAEWLRGHLFTGFPWNAPGYAVDGLQPLAQAASVTGLYGLNLLVVLWASLPALAGGQAARRLPAAFAIVLSAALCLAAGAWRLHSAEPAMQPDLLLRIVQPNVPQDEKWQPEHRRRIVETYLALTASGPAQAASGETVSHVVWPESALPVLLEDDPQMRQRIAAALPEDAMLLAGSLRRENPGGTGGRMATYNSILALSHEGEVLARSDKWHLVPFGEYLPLAAVLEPLGLRQLVTLPLGFGAGPGPRTVELPGTPAYAALVCYEIIFPHDLIARTERPAWLLNVTNDAWFGRTAGPYQHFMQARMRSIEEGLPLVRAANTGISSVVDPYGRILARLGLGEQGVLEARLPGPLPPTLYARAGDWPLLLAILAIAMLALRQARRVPVVSDPVL